MIGGVRGLSGCSGRMDWPRRGVYFFREPLEIRSKTGKGPRIVRVGTHALKAGSGTKLWTRLSQHKASSSTGGGNHRGSIFRLIVGAALAASHGYDFPTWGAGNTARGDVRKNELALEREVSQFIGKMPFLWLRINDDAGPESRRGYIESNSIALLSNYEKPPLDPPSTEWLGHKSDRERVRASGLWNQNHVDESYAPEFLDRLEKMVAGCAHMIVVIQCAASKQPDAGHLETAAGTTVCSSPTRPRLRRRQLSSTRGQMTRPDRGQPWRDVLLDYNQRVCHNPLGLFRPGGSTTTPSTEGSWRGWVSITSTFCRPVGD